MKKISTLIAFVFCHHLLFAQEAEISADVLSNEPDKASYIYFCANPFHFRLDNSVVNAEGYFNYELVAGFKLKNIVAADVGFTKSYSNYGINNTPLNTSQGNPVNGSNPYSNIVGRATFFVHKNMQEVEYATKLKQMGNVMHAGVIKADRMSLIGLRVGYAAVNNFGSSLLYRGYDKSDPNKTVGSYFGDTYGSNTSVTMLILGIARYRINDLHLNITGYGKRHVARTSELYAEMLFAGSIKIDDMLVSSGSLNHVATVDENTVKQTWGFRIGAKTYNNALRGQYGLNGFCYGFEAGVLPGIKARTFIDGVYVQVNAGIGFGTRIK